MKTRLVDGVEVHRGSGNVFVDLGLADAEKLKIKTGLVIEIRFVVTGLHKKLFNFFIFAIDTDNNLCPFQPGIKF